MKVDIVNKSAHPNPSYATIGSAGLDLRAFLKDSIILRPFERKVIPTGIYISLPIGYEAQVRPRSGLAVKHGLTVINSPGTIDSDYRGEIAVILANLSNSDFEVKNGDRIATEGGIVGKIISTDGDKIIIATGKKSSLTILKTSISLDKTLLINKKFDPEAKR